VTVADARDNPCRHCAREGRYVVHEGIPEDRCFWNREYKGFRPEGVCEEMGINFRSRQRIRREQRGKGKKPDNRDSRDKRDRRDRS